MSGNGGLMAGKAGDSVTWQGRLGIVSNGRGVQEVVSNDREGWAIVLNGR